MKCRRCVFASVDLNDAEDIYYCPFDDKMAYHSGDKCQHPFSYQVALSDLQEINNWYMWARERHGD